MSSCRLRSAHIQTGLLCPAGDGQVHRLSVLDVSTELVNVTVTPVKPCTCQRVDRAAFASVSFASVDVVGYRLFPLWAALHCSCHVGVLGHTLFYLPHCKSRKDKGFFVETVVSRCNNNQTKCTESSACICDSPLPPRCTQFIFEWKATPLPLHFSYSLKKKASECFTPITLQGFSELLDPLSFQSQLPPEDRVHYSTARSSLPSCQGHRGPVLTVAEVEHWTYRLTQKFKLSLHPLHLPATWHCSPIIHHPSVSVHVFWEDFKCRNVRKQAS